MKIDRYRCALSALVAFTLALGEGAEPATADEVCSHLFTFEREGFSKIKSDSGRHWVEVHWIGNWLDTDKGWRLECRHSSDDEAKQFCLWLVPNTSFEFADRLPRAILECHGYTFPDLSYWDDWKAEIDLYGHSDNTVLLEIDQTRHKEADRAIRVSSFRSGDDDATQPLAPLVEDK
jgi:hypothetical protein